MALEEAGYREQAIGDTWEKEDFYDDIKLKLYNVKSFGSFPLDNFRNPVTCIYGAAFDVNKTIKNIMKELGKIKWIM